jgi:hypothetical protein
LALEAVGTALAGGRAEHEVIRPFRPGRRRKAHALLRSRRVQPRHWHRLNRQGSHPLQCVCGKTRGVLTRVDERDEEDEEERAEGGGADSEPQGRHESEGGGRAGRPLLVGDGGQMMSVLQVDAVVFAEIASMSVALFFISFFVIFFASKLFLLR